MRFYILTILLIFNFNNANSEEKIAFIDLNYILNNSLSGKSINTFINNVEKEKNNEFKLIENQIKKDENELLAKKNIIEKNIYNKKVENIKVRINNYRNDRQNFSKSLDENKIKYTNKLLEKLNPIISGYVETNSITIVLPKKIVIIGKKNLDITLPILKILDETIQKITFDE